MGEVQPPSERPIDILHEAVGKVRERTLGLMVIQGKMRSGKVAPGKIGVLDLVFTKSEDRRGEYQAEQNSWRSCFYISIESHDCIFRQRETGRFPRNIYIEQKKNDPVIYSLTPLRDSKIQYATFWKIMLKKYGR
jgi:hypothetical protein